MKKKILIVTLFLSVFLSGMAVADSINGNYKGNPIVRVSVNGQAVNSEVPAQIIDGSTLLPLRAISEALGADVKWNPADYSVTVNTQKQQARLTQEQLNEISKYVAKVYAVQADGQAFSRGSGFLIGNGILVSNEHVVTNAQSVRIELNGKTYTTSDYLFKDATTDIMAVKINAAGGISYSTDLPKVDDRIYALGYPHGEFKITEGKVLAVQAQSGLDQIKHSAFTENGGSGGVLLNADGQIIGITTGVYHGTTDGMAVPMKYVQQEIDKLK